MKNITYKKRVNGIYVAAYLTALYGRQYYRNNTAPGLFYIVKKDIKTKDLKRFKENSNG